jgi:hypothetical protein
MLSAALMMALATVGFTRGASAGVTIDLVWRDTSTAGLTITAGDAGATCTLTGANGGVVPGRCMDVYMILTGDTLTGFGVSVAYPPVIGLTMNDGWQWFGTTFVDPQTGKTATFAPVTSHAMTAGGGVVTDMNGIVAPPNGPPSLPPGTYKIGTIVWDASGVSAGSHILSAFLTLSDGFANGAHVLITPILHNAVLDVIPEPGTASLLGLGLVGLIVAGRRGRK